MKHLANLETFSVHSTKVSISAVTALIAAGGGAIANRHRLAQRARRQVV